MSDLSCLKIQSMRERVSPDEWSARVDLAACYRLVHHYGMSMLIYNHITARVPGPDHHILINEFGLSYDEITPSSLVKIDLDGKVVHQGITVYGNKGSTDQHAYVQQLRDGLESAAARVPGQLGRASLTAAATPGVPDTNTASPGRAPLRLSAAPGGTISAKGKPGEGATFTVTLPRARNNHDN